MSNRQAIRKLITCGASIVIAAMSATGLSQATPPGRINYQGVVRDAAGAPLNGPVTMTFRFYDAASSGTLLWEEVYDVTVYPPQVTVAGGLFTVALGDAAHRNAGSETLFPIVFANRSDVYLAVKVAGDAEMTPRIKVASAPYSVNSAKLEGRSASTFANTAHAHAGGDVTTAVANATNADMLDGQHAGYFLDTSSSTQTKSGKLVLNNAGDYGINSSGGIAGGYFKDSSSSGEAYLAYGDAGIQARGSLVAGLFASYDYSSESYLGYANLGIQAHGNSAGGYFFDSNNSGYAYVGYGDVGIEASGNDYGGHFKNENGSGLSYVGMFDFGIQGMGNFAGGWFKDSNSSGEAFAGYGDLGLEARGNSAGGYFLDSNNSGYAWVGVGDSGIDGYGSGRGGYFKDSDGSGSAAVGIDDYGIQGWGTYAGGHFDDSDNSSWADVSYSTYKINGSGTVSFVQNHPIEKDKVIVYAAPEGDEVATYTRGTAKLVNGQARVKLGETFQWVTNPDLGLTAHLTAHGKAVPLAVASLSTSELMVNGPEDVAFDYLVYGLRIGFEESSIVQEKQHESYIPSFNDHRERYVKFPEMRAFSALERFKMMESSLRGVSPSTLDLTRARALRDAIHEYDPATDPPMHELFGHGPGPADAPDGTNPDSAASPVGPAAPALPQARRVASSGTRPGALAPVSAALPANLENDVKLPRPASSEPASAFSVHEAVEAGDVLVLNPANGDELYKCFLPADPMVVGIAADTAPAQSEVRVIQYGTTWVKADATTAPIARGDLLVASPTPGHAMKAQRSIEPGTVIGKALEPLPVGTGLIKVLVMLR